MKNKQKGFASALIILLAIIVIGGGIYFYNTSYPQNDTTAILENKIETSTSTDQADSQKNDTAVMVKGDVKNEDYTGLYHFGELGEKDSGVVMVYMLDIFKENDKYVAYLNIDGFQAKTRIKAKITQEGNILSVLFDSYLPRNISELYKKGNTLFTLDSSNKDKMKISWYSIEPSFKNTDLVNSYFEKLKGPILNNDQVRKDIIGKWKTVDAPYMIIFREDGTYQADINAGADHGTWKILQNLRSENDADEIQRDVPNGAYLKLTQNKELPLYYVIDKSTINTLKYIYMSGTASASIFDLVKIK